MNLLITGAASRLGQLLAADLRADHCLRLTDLPERAAALEVVPEGAEVVPAVLDHEAGTDQLVAGIDAIVHLAYVAADGEAANQWLDLNTRCTYNLLQAATDAGVRRVVFLSTLDILRAYEPNLAVAEDWRPRPCLEPEELGPYMGEFVAREFAHSGDLELVVLRLGHVTTEEEARQLPYDSMWVDARDVVGAVRAALDQYVHGFAVFHFQHVSPRARYAVRSERRHHHHPPHGRAEHRHRRPPDRRRPRRSLSYAPQHNFEAHP